MPMLTLPLLAVFYVDGGRVKCDAEEELLWCKFDAYGIMECVSDHRSCGTCGSEPAEGLDSCPSACGGSLQGCGSFLVCVQGKS